MEELIITSNGGRMSSLEIATLTSKEHKNIMRDIRNLLEQGVAALNFEPGNYKDANQQDRPCYYLTKKGCLILASGYDAKLREKIIDRWEELETEKQTGGFQIPQSYSEALKLAAAQAEQIEQQQKQLAEQAPSVVFRQAVEGAKTSCLVGELAKLIAQNGYNIGEKRLFAWLREHGYLGRHGERYNVPNQTYVEQGLFELKKGVRSGTGGVMHTTLTTKVTGKGQIYFVNKFLKQKELA